MNDKETYNNLCKNCRKKSKQNGLIDSYCKQCSKTLLNLHKIEFAD